MDLLKNFTAFISENNLFKKSDPLLVACSGGVDSVVLCNLLHSNGFQFSMAHCNFQLRGNESNSDEAFVNQLGNQYNVTVHVKQFDTNAYAALHKLNTQLAARALRYEWFYELLKTNNFSALLTAHHADDSVETVLMNLFKGTGISGMHGILPKRDKLVRPLLFATKKEILLYAKEMELSWVEDVSNATDKYTRNFFRHNILPLVEKVIPGAAVNAQQTITQLKETEILYRQSIETHKKKLLEFKGEEVHIPVLKFAKAIPFNSIAYEIIKDYGFASNQLPDLVSLLKAETGKYIASQTHRIIKNRKWLIIARLQSKEPSNILIEATDDVIAFKSGTLQLSMTDSTLPSADKTIAMLDAKQVKFPLLLRQWKTGDYFYPLGMPKKKKIARFLIDLKLSKTDKEKIWVIECRQKIIWVVGFRIDDRFKITPSTKKVLRIKFVG